MRIGVLWCVLASVSTLAVAQAPAGRVLTAEQAAAAFGAREAVSQASLSPDGTKIGFVAPTRGQGSALLTTEIAGGSPKAALAVAGSPERLDTCHWVASDRVACTIWGVARTALGVLPFSRVLAADENGGNVRLLSRRTERDDSKISLGGDEVIDWLAGSDGEVLIGRTYVQREKAGTRIHQTLDGFGVDRLNTRNLSSTRVETPNPEAIEYISDGSGNVRIMGIRNVAGATQMDEPEIDYRYRKADSKRWEDLGTWNGMTRQGFNPLLVDKASDSVFGFKYVDGRQALVAIKLDGSKAERVVMAHPQVDVDDVRRIGRHARAIGASYATEQRQAVYFDPAIAKIAEGLHKALPGLALQFVDATDDESKLLIFAGSDVDPGSYYLYDKATHQLRPLLDKRSELAGVTLADVKPVSYQAADGAIIPAYLTLPPGSAGKNIPAIVMPHGGPESRDEWGFDWLSQFFANRGYAVLQPNFRGSSGYGEAWFQKNGFQSWRVAVGDVADGGRWLVSQGIANPAKLAIVGASYGGYAALQAAVVEPGLFKAVVAIAPVTDLAKLKEQQRGWTNYRLVSDFIGSGPHIQQGSPAQNAGRISVPVMLHHGDYDRNVDIGHSKLMADKLRDAGKQVQMLEYPGIDHHFEDSVQRTRMLRETDAFLAKSLGG